MSKETHPDSEKHSSLGRLLEGEYALVHLDPSVQGVRLPEHLLAQPTVTLKLSKLFRGAVELRDDRVEAELLFGSEYFSCLVPFEAIWGITDAAGKNFIWPETAPGDILTRLQTQTSDKSENKESDKAVKKQPHLRRVK